MTRLVSGLLILHGMITAWQAKGSFSLQAPVPNPAWLSWWKTPLGQSWLFPRMNIYQSSVVGFIWIISGLLFIGAALGINHFVIPYESWRLLSGLGAILSLGMLLIYAHPLYIIGGLANLSILFILLSANWPAV